jgi:hypothetical protein
MRILILATCVFLFLSISVFAWFTYVQRKNFGVLISQEVAFQIRINDAAIGSFIDIKDLTYIDFEKDLILNQSSMLYESASIHPLEINLNPGSPFVKVIFQLSDIEQEGLILLLMIDDLDATELHQTILTIIHGYENLEDAYHKILEHNQMILDQLNQVILGSQDHLRITLFVWGDYHQAYQLEVPYLEMTYRLTMTIRLTTNLGGQS